MEPLSPPPLLRRLSSESSGLTGRAAGGAVVALIAASCSYDSGRESDDDLDYDEVMEWCDEEDMEPDSHAVGISHCDSDSDDEAHVAGRTILKQLSHDSLLDMRDRFSDVVDVEPFALRGKLGTNILSPPTLMQENVHTLASSPVKLERYLGSNARSSFLSKINVAYHEETIKGDAGMEVGYNKPTAFLPSKEESVDIPFAPRRPKKKISRKNIASIESLGDVSCLEGFDDRPGLHIDVQSTVGSVENLDVADYEQHQPLSPRTTFISGCIKEKINPRASLMLRKNVSKTLDLQHQGMGDTMGVIFSRSLTNMPFLQAINLSDNHLTDISLRPIIEALSSLPGLTHLNLSNNIINRQAARALAMSVAKNSTLRELILSKSDLSDYECQLFVVAASENATLSVLDLSNNDIGKCDLSHALNRRDGNGPEALSSLLVSNYCCLESLNLRWNHITLQGAISIAESISLNSTLIHLDLAYNSLGNKAGEIIGSAILSNKTIATLNLENNNIQGSGCFTICIGILENLSLKNVCLDNNPFSELGAAILMKLPLAVGHRVKISAKNCNFHKKNYKDSSSEVFDHASPANKYDLNLEKPFERAVAIRLLYLVAASPQYQFHKFQYQKPKKRNQKGRKNEWRNIILSDSVSKDKIGHLSDDDNAHIKNLIRLREAAADIKQARLLFEKYDKDGNNSLDVNELHDLLADIGIPSDRSVIEEAINVYDVDGEGTIEIDEFCLYLKGLTEEASRVLSDLTETKILVQQRRPDIKYIPPSTGKLSIIVDWNFSNTKPRQVVTRSALHDCAEMIKEGNIGAKVMLMKHAIDDVYLRKNEALYLYRLVKEDIKDPVEILPMILSRMYTPDEADQVISHCLPKARDRRRLRNLLGCCLNPILGIYNGYYELNLGFEKDRECLKQLLAMGEVNKSKAIASSLFRPGVTGDLSQKGDWSCFRNVLYKGQPFHISLHKFHPMVTSGILCFDFSGSLKPPRKSKPLSDRRCLNTLKKIGILKECNVSQSQAKLRDMKVIIANTIRGDGNFSNNISKEKSKRIQHHQLQFYGSLESRISQVREVRDLECVQISRFEDYNVNTTAKLTDTNVNVESDSDVSSVSSSESNTRGVDVEIQENSHTYVQDNELNKDKTRKQSSNGAPNNALRITSRHQSASTRHSTVGIPTEKKKAVTVIKVKFGYGKAAHITQEILNIFQRVWMRCSQLTIVLNLFRIGKLKKSEYFGTYRVEIVCNTFHRLIDVHNFDLVLNELSSQEIACVYCRIGMLNIFNPMKPEGWHFLNMSHREERSIAKMLMLLSVEEPGKNWIDATFQWKYDGEVIPGWALPSRWMLDKNVPHHGFMHLEYYCGRKVKGEGYSSGCSALVPLRKSLFHLVYIEEEDVVCDDANIDESGKRIHRRVVKMDKFGKKGSIISSGQILSKGKHAVQWNNLLAPLNSTSVKIADGITIEAIFEREKTRRNSEMDVLKEVVELNIGEPSTTSSTSRIVSSSRGKRGTSRPKKTKMDLSLPGAASRASVIVAKSPQVSGRKILESFEPGSDSPRPATAMATRRASRTANLK